MLLDQVLVVDPGLVRVQRVLEVGLEVAVLTLERLEITKSFEISFARPEGIKIKTFRWTLFLSAVRYLL